MSYLALALAAPLVLAAIALLVLVVHLKRKTQTPSEPTMTKKVKILNADDYPADVTVTPVSPTTGEPTNSQTYRLAPGESCEAYIHGGQSLRIDEAPLGAKIQGGGGPGEEKREE